MVIIKLRQTIIIFIIMIVIINIGITIFKIDTPYFKSAKIEKILMSHFNITE